jgi:hypothetical protein
MRRIRLSFNKIPNPQSSTPQFGHDHQIGDTAAMELANEHAGHTTQTESAHGK